MTCDLCPNQSYTHVVPYLCVGCIETKFYSYWAMCFAQTCAVAASNGDDEIARRRLYNELKAIGMV